MKISKEQFITAFQNPKILTEDRLKLLNTLYSFPNHEATTIKLSEALNGTESKSLYSQFGRFAHRVADEFNIVPDLKYSDGSPEWWTVLASGYRDEDDFFVWKLHKELVEAMEELELTLDFTKNEKRYWVGASYYGPKNAPTDMLTEFLKHNYWRTDHDLTIGEGLNILNELKKVKINDRICVRYYGRKNNKIFIKAIGTVISTLEINDGKLSVSWDKNSFLYEGDRPLGKGSGNWWKTFFELVQPDAIAKIFNENKNEARIARLTWNEFGWVKPSGSNGKSLDKASHEFIYGYGHEEWLFDTSKLINGYKYGFLEPLRKHQESFTNINYKIWLYSFNSAVNKRFWIGTINNLKVLSVNESEEIRKIYLEEGWLNEMENQIKEVNANEKGFSNWKGINQFNVKFKLEDIFINDPYFELPLNHPVYNIHMYIFGHYDNRYEIPIEDFIFQPSIEGNEDDDLKVKTGIQYREPKQIEIKYFHSAISKSLTKYLRNIYTFAKVTKEHKTGYGGNRIDIVVDNNSKLIFYEIKTYNSISTSVREALGQLMEYCFYSDKIRAAELIIVTHLPITPEIEKYFKHLRKTLNLNIYYQHYDLEKEILSEKF